MKETFITVSWSRTIKMEVDEKLIHNQNYKEEIQAAAVKCASECVELSDGMVVDCEDFPSLIE